jgi:hypothetical protein
MLIANLVSLGCPCTGEGVEWLYDRDLEFFGKVEGAVLSGDLDFSESLGRLPEAASHVAPAPAFPF